MISTVYIVNLEAGSAATDTVWILSVAALTGTGLGLLGIGAWLVWKDRALGAASLAWPTAEGTIKSSRVTPFDADGIEKHVASITYDYSVRGRSYTGDRVRFGGYAGSLQKAQRDVDRYPAGSRVAVRYAPRQPQTSTLEPGAAGVSAAGLALAAGGAALLAVSLAVVSLT